MLIVPGKRLAMYSCTLEGGCRPGCGPLRFALGMTPLPLATSNRLPSGVARTHVGYHPVGMKPSERLLPGSETSNSATTLMFALATYNRFSSGESARLFGVEPGNDCGNNSATSVSMTSPVWELRTLTVLRLALAT